MLDYGPLVPLCEKTNPSIKPDVHKILRSHQTRTEPRPQATCTENFVKFGRVVFMNYNMSWQTDTERYRHRRTDRHSDTLIVILLPLTEIEVLFKLCWDLYDDLITNLRWVCGERILKMGYHSAYFYKKSRVHFDLLTQGRLNCLLSDVIAKRHQSVMTFKNTCLYYVWIKWKAEQCFVCVINDDDYNGSSREC